MSTEIGRRVFRVSERAQYLAMGGRQLYCARHAAADGEARGRVLLVGPIGSERTYSYNTWARWARVLAQHRFDVVRFDYRGVGESTGSSSDVSWSDWVDDAAAASGLLEGDGPLLLHGFRFGGWVAEALMERGIGDGLLTWGRHEGGRQGIVDLLRNHVAAEAVVAGVDRFGSVEAMVAELEVGREVEAEGFTVGPRLWRDVEAVSSGRPEGPRIRHVRLATGGGERGVRVGRPPFWRPGQVLRPDLEELFRISVAWLEEVADAVGH